MRRPGSGESDVAGLAGDVSHDLANLEMMAHEFAKLLEEPQGAAQARTYLREFLGAVEDARSVAQRLRTLVTP